MFMTGKSSLKRSADDDGGRIIQKSTKLNHNSTTSSSEIASNSKIRKVYCDGSALGNGNKGSVAGIGVWWSDKAGTR